MVRFCLTSSLLSLAFDVTITLPFSSFADKIPFNWLIESVLLPWFTVVTSIVWLPPVEEKLTDDGSTDTIIGLLEANPLTSSRLRGINWPAL